jgi:Domain of unknown function (DU1801)
MPRSRPIHPDFRRLLDRKSAEVIALFTDLRSFMLEVYPSANELLYHTHALTTAFSISEKLSDAYCVIPIYTDHLNLGFTRGTVLKDPHHLLTGTGILIRHIPVSAPDHYRNARVKALVKAAVEYAISDMDQATASTGKSVSKIKAS